MMVPTLDVHELKDKIDSKESFVLLDVREPHEHDLCRIDYGDNLLIPVGEIEERLDELDSSQTYVCYCRSGMRSAKATQLMVINGFEVENLDGGILAWSREIDSTIPQY